LPEWSRPFVCLEIRHLLIRRAMLYTSTGATIVSFITLGKSEFDAVIFECHSYQDGIYETPEDAAGRSEHDIREGLCTVPADGITCSRPVTQRE
jgi:hypothetical protein